MSSLLKQYPACAAAVEICETNDGELFAYLREYEPHLGPSRVVRYIVENTKSYLRAFPRDEEARRLTAALEQMELPSFLRYVAGRLGAV